MSRGPRAIHPHVFPLPVHTLRGVSHTTVQFVHTPCGEWLVTDRPTAPTLSDGSSVGTPRQQAAGSLDSHTLSDVVPTVAGMTGVNH